MKTRAFALVLPCVFAVLFASCYESPCDRNMRISSPEYYSLYVYKFREGKDYSNNVVLISNTDDSTAYYISGFAPIKLHGGYYLGGNIPKLINPRGMIHYLTLTYSDLETGNVPDDWLEHWKDYRIMPEECVFEWFYCYGRCSCDDAGCYYTRTKFYNRHITLDVPVEDDIHTDTAILNNRIDNNNLSGLGFMNWTMPSHCRECD